MTPQRYHALDNLRSILMWLGIVLHVTLNHITTESPFPWKDNSTSIGADLLLIFIHAFRMPAFFILAGFFVAMLIDRDGHQEMLVNRLKRIALPFILFWPIYIVIIMILGLMFVSKIENGDVNINLSRVSESSLFKTHHLWFLYDLIWLCLLAFLAPYIGRLISVARKGAITSLLLKLAKNWWGAIFLTLPLVFVGMFYEHGYMTFDGSFMPNILELIHYGSFFAFGCFFYTQRTILMTHYQQYCWRYFSAGIFLFIIALIPNKMSLDGRLAAEYDRALPAFAYNIVGWLGSFALIGIFIRYSSQYSKVLRYLSDSSYWVYLVHFFGTTGFGIFLYNSSMPLLPKILINIFLTSVVCLLSYHLFVRYSWIGKLLNGRRHQRKH